MELHEEKKKQMSLKSKTSEGMTGWERKYSAGVRSIWSLKCNLLNKSVDCKNVVIYLVKAGTKNVLGVHNHEIISCICTVREDWEDCLFVDILYRQKTKKEY